MCDDRQGLSCFCNAMIDRRPAVTVLAANADDVSVLNSAFDALVPPGLQHHWKASFVKGAH